MDRRKVLSSKVPYIELFGVDGMGKGRPGNDTPASELLPKLELPLMADQSKAMQIRSMARTRAITVLKTVFAREFLAIYEKEVLHLVRMFEKEEGVPSPVAADGESSSMV